MKKVLKLISAILAVMLVMSAFVACSSDKGGANDDDPAVAAVRKLIDAYYKDINGGNYDGIGKYFGSEITDVQEKITSFKFNAEYYTSSYEIDSIEALYLENGNISATVTTIRTSVDKTSGKKTVVSEPSTYIIGAETEGGEIVILMMAIGESSIIELET